MFCQPHKHVENFQGLLASGGVREGVWQSFANVQSVQSCGAVELSLISISISQSDAVPLSGLGVSKVYQEAAHCKLQNGIILYEMK